MPSICHEVIIAATAEKIFKAITSPNRLARWWTPLPLEA